MEHYIQYMKNAKKIDFKYKYILQILHIYKTSNLIQ